MTAKKGLALSSPLASILDRDPRDFRRADFLRVIEERGIEKITFHYFGLDGRLKELKIPVMDSFQVETILTEGERVDGSSLYRGLVDMGLSDLYVVPVYRTAFFNPFDEKSLDFICRYLDRDGLPVPFTFDNILLRAHQLFKEHTGLELRALGELEFFLISEQPNMYPAERQRGYHSSSPFFKTGPVLDEMVRLIAQLSGAVKYAHSEVGYIERIESEVEEIAGKSAEQVEIEFLPEPVEACAEHLVLARWIIRNVAYRHRMVATFVPKLDEGVAGNGLHFHLELRKDGKNIMTGADGNLSREARSLIGGLCHYADSLTAFGNTVASSYLRLVPHHEAPTRICWSDLNRSAMIRVPLGWTRARNLAAVVNPEEKQWKESTEGRQTVEMRTADGSALIHLFLAGMTMAADWALNPAAAGESGLKAAELAEKLYVSGNIFQDKKLLESLQSLPASCQESAAILREKRYLYERDHVFPKSIIEYVISLLEKENDRDLSQRLAAMSDEERKREMRRIMHRDLHRH